MVYVAASERRRRRPCLDVRCRTASTTCLRRRRRTVATPTVDRQAPPRHFASTPSLSNVRLHDSQPFRSRANSLPCRSESANITLANSLPGTFAPGSEMVRELATEKIYSYIYTPRKFQGTKWLGNERTRERIAPGSIGRFAPGSELARGSEKARYPITHRHLRRRHHASVALIIFYYMSHSYNM